MNKISIKDKSGNMHEVSETKYPYTIAWDYIRMNLQENVSRSTISQIIGMVADAINVSKSQIARNLSLDHITKVSIK